MEEIIATPTYERFRFDNPGGSVVILSAYGDLDGRRVEFGLKGPELDGEPSLGVPYRFYGKWQEYRNKRTGDRERQFAYRSLVKHGSPKGRDAVVGYLSSCQGVGRVLAGRIYDAFGEEAIDRLRMDPAGSAKSVSRLAPAVAQRLAAWLADNIALENVMVEMAGLLKNRGMPRDLPRLVVKRWGSAAAVKIKQNPYRLMEFPGVGFKRADALYLELGGNPTRLKRQALCCQHAIRNAGTGDTWHFHEVARAALRRSIAGADVDADRAIRLALRGGLLSAQWTDGRDGPLDGFGTTFWLADARAAASERRVANEVARIRRHAPLWRGAAGDSLSEHQQKALGAATSEAMGCLTGSPGTGKTYTVAALVRWLEGRFAPGAIALAAPTGKAAVRLTETMQLAGLTLRASTIHSLLEVDASEGAGWAFKRHAGNPLECTFLVVDESSMVDTDLFAQLLAAVPDGGHVLLVGDVNQLLPVGHGAPLRDLVAAGLPVGELREIRRNSGAIVEACAAIRDNQPFVVDGNLSHATDGSAVDVILQAAAAESVCPVNGVQLLVAVNKSGPLSRRELNRQLQRALNPAHEDGQTFSRGDKVVCLRNGDYQVVGGEVDPGVAVSENETVRVANGELGVVRAVDGRRMHVELSAPRRVVLVPIGARREPAEEAPWQDQEAEDDTPDTGCSWDLAYALSVHKSQGSEFPVAVVCLDDSPAASRVGDRAWVYTAISRAKKRCVLWGPLKAAREYARRNRIAQRKTFLRERLEGQG